MQQTWRVPLVEFANGAYVCEAKEFFVSHSQYKQDFKVIKNIKNYHVLFVPKNVRFDSFIGLKNLFDKYPQNMIVILEKYASLKLFVDESFSFLHVYLYESSNLNCFFSLLGSANCKSELSISLLGKNACASIKGAYIVDNNKALSLKTYQAHLAQDTSSEVVIHGIASENACVTYRGNIFVAQKAVRAKALQGNKNIMLCQGVCIDAKPQMEILNNDVQCKHGCAVGVLDENQLFYLQARGLDQNQAKRLMLKGLFEHVLHVLNCPKLSNEVEKKIKARLSRFL